MSKIKLSEKLTQFDKINIDKIMENCEIYREKLIKHCQRQFDLTYEQAEDCVQDSYVALYENLLHGIEIDNYRAWLYQVTINYKNKVIREKLQQNEYDFVTNEEKDKALENTVTYAPDYVENMVTDEMIEERAMKILLSLNKDEQDLYVKHYWEHKTFVEIGAELGKDSSTIGKRHSKMRKKIIKMIKEYEKN